jgi:hypothetical protein
MAVRIVLLLLGAGLAAAGGYLGWRDRGLVGALFPPAAGGAPWLLVGALALVCLGLVLAVAAVIPRPERAARLAAAAARREETLARADRFYAERARAADRDWRSGEIAPPAAPVPPDLDEGPAPTAPVTLSQNLPSPSLASAPAPAQARPQTPLEAIRAAMAEGRLDEADRLLGEERDRLIAMGQPGQAALAELTGVAGDHAAAAGRPGHAKWLWRLALKRFGESGAISNPAAHAVSERLRSRQPERATS